MRSTSPFNNIDPSRKLENIITGSEPSITFRDWFCKNTKYDFLALVTVNIGYQIFHWSFIFSLWKESMEVMGWTWKIREKLGTGQIKGGRICSSHLQIRNLGPIHCSHYRKIESAGFVRSIAVSTLSTVYLLKCSSAASWCAMLQGKTVFNIIGILNIKVAPRWTEATPARLHQTSAAGSF